jgi:hypothetical protein
MPILEAPGCRGDGKVFALVATKMGPCVLLLGFTAAIIIRTNLSSLPLAMRGTLERDCEASNGRFCDVQRQDINVANIPSWLIGEDHL